MSMKIQRMLVSQPKPLTEKSPYYTLAQKYGVDLVFRPFIKVEGLNVREFRTQKIEILDYTAIIFTARTAIDHFFRLAGEMRITIPEDMKYFCNSETIANYLQKYIQYRKRKVHFPATGKFEDLVTVIKKHPGEKYLMAVADVNKDTNIKMLEAAKINVDKATFYKTVSNDFGPDEPFDYDLLAFFSPEGINSLFKNFPDYQQGDCVIAAFGANTAKAVENAGLRLDIQAPTPECPSMPAAIEKFFKDNKVNKK